MFAIAFDLVVKDTEQHHPKHNCSNAYQDIRNTVEKFGFVWRQGSLYTTESDDMSKLFAALMALKALPWFPRSVRDIRAFKVEQWSDFTALIKTP